MQRVNPWTILGLFCSFIITIFEYPLGSKNNPREKFSTIARFKSTTSSYDTRIQSSLNWLANSANNTYDLCILLLKSDEQPH